MSAPPRLTLAAVFGRLLFGLVVSALYVGLVALVEWIA